MGATKELFQQMTSEVSYPHSLIIEEQYYQIQQNDTEHTK